MVCVVEWFGRVPIVRLWKLASAALYDTLRREGVLYFDPGHLSDRDDWFFWEQPYRWMGEQMRQRLLPPAAAGRYPWWAWHRWDRRSPRPDLRARWSNHWWPAGTLCVRLELELPACEVLLSDFEAWHAVLNDHYLAFTEEEWDAWDALPESQRSRSALEASWERVFTFRDWPLEAQHLYGQPGARIQACFETLRLCDVRAVTYYRSRPVHGPRAAGVPSESAPPEDRRDERQA